MHFFKKHIFRYQFTWSREAILCLIETYENYPCLYVTTSDNYKNRNIKNKALEEIANDLNKKLLTSLTAKEVQAKLHGLRTQYLGELNKIKKSKVSGTSSDSVYVPKWQFFEKLHFLGVPAAVVTQGESNIDHTQVTQESINVEETDTQVSIFIFVT